MTSNENRSDALQATYSDLKIIKTRGSFQIILEAPLSDFNHAMAVLGGAPRPDQEVWVAVVRLNESLVRVNRPPEIKSPSTLALESTAPQETARETVSDAPKEKRTWFDMPAAGRASMRCADHRFWTWLHDIGRISEPAEAPTLEYVRRISGGSRGNLGKNGFEKETEAWDIVDHAYAKYLERKLIESMR